MRPTKFQIPEKDDSAFAFLFVKVAATVAVLSIVAAIATASAIDGPRVADASSDAQPKARRAAESTPAAAAREAAFRAAVQDDAYEN